MRTLALDVGDRRIGVAVSDPGGIVAQPLTTVERSGDPAATLASIRGLLAQHGAGCVVVGLPRNLNGGIGRAATRVSAFAGWLGAQIDVPVVLWDERLTSVEANRRLIEAGVRRRRRREVVDRVAAALILQGYLDRQHVEEDPEKDPEAEGSEASAGG